MANEPYGRETGTQLTVARINVFIAELKQGLFMFVCTWFNILQLTLIQPPIDQNARVKCLYSSDYVHLKHRQINKTLSYGTGKNIVFSPISTQHSDDFKSIKSGWWLHFSVIFCLLILLLLGFHRHIHSVRISVYCILSIRSYTLMSEATEIRTQLTLDSFSGRCSQTVCRYS